MDYSRVKEDYLSGMTESEMMAKHGMSLDSLRMAIRKNNWSIEKKALKAVSVQKAMKRCEVDVVAELSLINGQDIAITKRIRQQMARKLEMMEEMDEVPLQDLAVLARIHTDVQRVARTALDAGSEAMRAEIIGRKSLSEYTETELMNLLEKVE